MGRSTKKKSLNKKKSPATVTTSTTTSPPPRRSDDGGLYVDPARIRFQHSRIRPYFSGCGRSVEETLESIRRKELSPLDLPPIQVMRRILVFLGGGGGERLG